MRFISMCSLLNTFRIFMLLRIKKHYFIQFCCLFLKLSKAFTVSLKSKLLSSKQGYHLKLAFNLGFSVFCYLLRILTNLNIVNFHAHIDYLQLSQRSPFLQNKFYWISFWYKRFRIIRSSRAEVFLGNGVLKICSKFTGEHPCLSVISIKLLCT